MRPSPTQRCAPSLPVFEAFKRLLAILEAAASGQFLGPRGTLIFSLRKRHLPNLLIRTSGSFGIQRHDPRAHRRRTSLLQLLGTFLRLWLARIFDSPRLRSEARSAFMTLDRFNEKLGQVGSYSLQTFAARRKGLAWEIAGAPGLERR